MKTQRLEAHENFLEHICPMTRFFDEVNGLRSPDFPEIGVFTQSRAVLGITRLHPMEFSLPLLQQVK